MQLKAPIRLAVLIGLVLLFATPSSLNAEGTPEDLSTKAGEQREALSKINNELDALFERIANDSDFAKDLDFATNKDDRISALNLLREDGLITEARIEHLELFPENTRINFSICWALICVEVEIEW